MTYSYTGLIISYCCSSTIPNYP